MQRRMQVGGGCGVVVMMMAGLMQADVPVPVAEAIAQLQGETQIFIYFAQHLLRPGEPGLHQHRC